VDEVHKHRVVIQLAVMVVAHMLVIFATIEKHCFSMPLQALLFCILAVDGVPKSLYLSCRF